MDDIKITGSADFNVNVKGNTSGFDTEVAKSVAKLKEQLSKGFIPADSIAGLTSQINGLNTIIKNMDLSKAFTDPTILPGLTQISQAIVASEKKLDDFRAKIESIKLTGKFSEANDSLKALNVSLEESKNRLNSLPAATSFTDVLNEVREYYAIIGEINTKNYLNLTAKLQIAMSPDVPDTIAKFKEIKLLSAEALNLVVRTDTEQSKAEITKLENILLNANQNLERLQNNAKEPVSVKIDSTPATSIKAMSDAVSELTEEVKRLSIADESLYTSGLAELYDKLNKLKASELTDVKLRISTIQELGYTKTISELEELKSLASKGITLTTNSEEIKYFNSLIRSSNLEIASIRAIAEPPIELKASISGFETRINELKAQLSSIDFSEVGSFDEAVTINRNLDILKSNLLNVEEGIKRVALGLRLENVDSVARLNAELAKVKSNLDVISTGGAEDFKYKQQIEEYYNIVSKLNSRELSDIKIRIETLTSGDEIPTTRAMVQELQNLATRAINLTVNTDTSESETELQRLNSIILKTREFLAQPIKLDVNDDYAQNILSKYSSSYTASLKEMQGDLRTLKDHFAALNVETEMTEQRYGLLGKNTRTVIAATNESKNKMREYSQAIDLLNGRINTVTSSLGRIGKQWDGVTGHQTLALQTSRNLGYTLNDLATGFSAGGTVLHQFNFGLNAIANNVPMLIEGLNGLKTAGGGLRGMFTSLAANMGVFGWLTLAISGAQIALSLFDRAQREAADGAKLHGKSVKDLALEIQKMKEEAESGKLKLEELYKFKGMQGYTMAETINDATTQIKNAFDYFNTAVMNITKHDGYVPSNITDIINMLPKVISTGKGYPEVINKIRTALSGNVPDNLRYKLQQLNEVIITSTARVNQFTKTKQGLDAQAKQTEALQSLFTPELWNQFWETAKATKNLEAGSKAYISEIAKLRDKIIGKIQAEFDRRGLKLNLSAGLFKDIINNYIREEAVKVVADTNDQRRFLADQSAKVGKEAFEAIVEPLKAAKKHAVETLPEPFDVSPLFAQLVKFDVSGTARTKLNEVLEKVNDEYLSFETKMNDAIEKGKAYKKRLFDKGKATDLGGNVQVYKALSSEEIDRIKQFLTAYGLTDTEINSIILENNKMTDKLKINLTKLENLLNGAADGQKKLLDKMQTKAKIDFMKGIRDSIDETNKTPLPPLQADLEKISNDYNKKVSNFYETIENSLGVNRENWKTFYNAYKQSKESKLDISLLKVDTLTQEKDEKVIESNILTLKKLIGQYRAFLDEKETNTATAIQKYAVKIRTLSDTLNDAYNKMANKEVSAMQKALNQNKTEISDIMLRYQTSMKEILSPMEAESLFSFDKQVIDFGDVTSTSENITKLSENLRVLIDTKKEGLAQKGIGSGVDSEEYKASVKEIQNYSFWYQKLLQIKKLGIQREKTIRESASKYAVEDYNQQLKVNGVMNMFDKVAEQSADTLANGFMNGKLALDELVKSIELMIVKMTILAGLKTIIGSIFGKSGGFNFFGMLGGLLGFSSGGIVPLYASTGSLVRGTDTVPAMLTPGEMILNSTQQANLWNLINKKTRENVVETKRVQTQRLDVSLGGGVRIDRNDFVFLLQKAQANYKSKNFLE